MTLYVMGVDESKSGLYLTYAKRNDHKAVVLESGRYEKFIGKKYRIDYIIADSHISTVALERIELIREKSHASNK